MPTYEYACSSCNHQWEEFQRISEPASTVCPQCKQESARRQISAGNFILKGGGWYADLYSSTKKASASSGEGSKTNDASGANAPSEGAKKSDATAAASSSSGGGSSDSSSSASSSSTSGKTSGS
ncbi:MAG TPA: zinc ribbon domain-containing protein [Polyangiaceae bacterium]|nr:zinc ribbon domain-containing protein [Polyangiaceae bacterium]